MLANCSYYVQNQQNTVNYYDSDGNLLLNENIPTGESELFQGQSLTIPDFQAMDKRIDNNAPKPRPIKIRLANHEKFGKCVYFYDKNEQSISCNKYSGNDNLNDVARTFSKIIDTDWLLANTDKIEFKHDLNNTSNQCVLC